MLDLFKKYFGNSPQPTQKTLKTESPADNEKKILVATCALFVELAKADGEFSTEERQSIIGILKDKHGLSKDDADALLEEASVAIDKSVDLWHFTNEINQNFMIEEKQHIVQLLWTIVYADGHLDAHEEYLTRKLTKLLRLDHSDFIAAKIKAKQAN